VLRTVSDLAEILGRAHWSSVKEDAIVAGHRKSFIIAFFTAMPEIHGITRRREAAKFR